LLKPDILANTVVVIFRVNVMDKSTGWGALVCIHPKKETYIRGRHPCQFWHGIFFH